MNTVFQRQQGEKSMAVNYRNPISVIVLWGCLIVFLFWIAARLTQTIGQAPAPAPVRHAVNVKSSHSKPVSHNKK